MLDNGLSGNHLRENCQSSEYIISVVISSIITVNISFLINISLSSSTEKWLTLQDFSVFLHIRVVVDSSRVFWFFRFCNIQHRFHNLPCKQIRRRLIWKSTNNRSKWMHSCVFMRKPFHHVKSALVDKSLSHWDGFCNIPFLLIHTAIVAWQQTIHKRDAFS